MSVISPLVSAGESRKAKDEIAAGDLVTWVDYAGRQLGGRILEILRDGSYLLKTVGLAVPDPYAVGMIFPIDAEKIIDW